MTHFIKHQFYFIFVLSCMLILSSCALTKQARHFETSGFLGDYSQLQEGKRGQALLVYINPETDFSQYDKIIIDSVTIWGDEKGNWRHAEEDELQMLSDYLYLAVKQSLEQDYSIVEEPGPNTMKVRIAITEAKGSNVPLDFVTNIVPVGIAISLTQRLAAGTHSFVGKASVEAELVDSQTGLRLAAAVDRRAGNKVLRGKFGTWNDIKEAYDYWAEKLHQSLMKLRNSTQE